MKLPISFRVKFKKAKLPSKKKLIGKYCFLEPKNNKKHSKDLFKNFSLDKKGIDWTYMPTGPYKSEISLKKYLKDKKIMNRNSLLEVSKKILTENRDFKAPNETKFNLPGKTVKDEMIKILEKLHNDKIILDHGMEVGKELANVLSGGDTIIDKTLSEDDIFKLELNSFMRLIETKKTQERITHTLLTGKPLIN